MWEIMLSNNIIIFTVGENPLIRRKIGSVGVTYNEWLTNNERISAKVKLTFKLQKACWLPIRRWLN